MPRYTTIAVGSRLAGVILLGVLAGCPASSSDTSSVKESPPIPIKVASAEGERLQRTIRVLGTLHADEEATLSSEVTGVLQTLRADVGDVVSGGAVLAELAPRNFAQSVAAARWSRQEAFARLGVTTLPREDFQIDRVAPVARAKAQLANARVKLERLQRLDADGRDLVVQQDLKDAETNVEVAVANVDVERLAARALIAEAGRRQVELETAESRLADTRIVAPPTSHAWEIAERLSSEGEYVPTGTRLFRIVAVRVLKLRAPVPERYVSLVRLGQSVAVRVEAYGDKPFEGKVTRVNPTVDPASRTFGVQIQIQNPQGNLRPGSFARAEILTRVEPAVLVPLEAVVSVAGINKVYVYESGLVRELLVTPGQRRGSRVEVSGVQVGEHVVTSGQTVVTDGAKVELLSERGGAK